MPKLKTYKLMISHSWKYDEQYKKVVGWLEDANDFDMQNYSVCCDNPLDTTTDSELEDALTTRVKECNCIIVLAGMYANYSKWMDFEIDKAVEYGKPIVGVKPWGNERVPAKISENADEIVNWQSSSVVQAVRDNAD